MPNVELYTVAPLKWTTNAGGLEPTLSSANNVFVGDEVLDMDVTPPRVWLCLDNTPGGTLYLRIDAAINNKGWFANATALRAAHPTANAGDFATVGSGASGPSVWVWDTGIADWEDTATSGLVTSVFGRTAAISAQAGDYAAFYDTLGAASSAVAGHNLAFVHSDIALNTAARHVAATAGTGISVTGQQIANTDTGSSAVSAHNLAFVHSDIALNTAARHARSHALNSASDHSGNLSATQMPTSGTWTLTGNLAIARGTTPNRTAILHRLNIYDISVSEGADTDNFDTSIVQLNPTSLDITNVSTYDVGGNPETYTSAISLNAIGSGIIQLSSSYNLLTTTRIADITMRTDTVASISLTTTNLYLFSNLFTGVSTGGVSNNDKLPTRGYVDNALASKWDATVVHAAASKATPVDADELPLLDSAATFALKTLTWANLKTTLNYEPAFTNLAASKLPTGGNWALTSNLVINSTPSDVDITIGGNGGNALKYDYGDNSLSGRFFNINYGGVANTFLGVSTGRTAATGTNNVAIGGAGTSLTSGYGNVLIGNVAGNSTQATVHNVYIGNGAGGRRQANYDIAIGMGAMAGSITPASNTGERSVAIGAEALLDMTSGSSNIAVGDSAGHGLTTGSYCLFLGRHAGYTATTVSNMICLGYSAGKYETAGDKLFVDAFDRTNEAGDRSNAIIYGVMASGGAASQSITFNVASHIVPSTAYHYFGDSATDGSWRIGRSYGNDLSFERRESGSWVSKGSFTA